MNRHPHHIAIDALLGAAGGFVSCLAHHLWWMEPLCRAVSFYGGGLLVVFSLVSVGIDLRRCGPNRKGVARRTRRGNKARAEQRRETFNIEHSTPNIQGGKREGLTRGNWRHRG